MKPRTPKNSLKAARNSQPRLIDIPKDGEIARVGDYWYYGKNSPPNSGNYHFAVVCGYNGHIHVQESGKKATLAEAQRIAQNHIELDDERRHITTKLQKQVHSGKISLDEAVMKIARFYSTS